MRILALQRLLHILKWRITHSIDRLKIANLTGHHVEWVEDDRGVKNKENGKTGEREGIEWREEREDG